MSSKCVILRNSQRSQFIIVSPGCILKFISHKYTRFNRKGTVSISVERNEICQLFPDAETFCSCHEQNELHFLLVKILVANHNSKHTGKYMVSHASQKVHKGYIMARRGNLEKAKGLRKNGPLLTQLYTRNCRVSSVFAF